MKIPDLPPGHWVMMGQQCYASADDPVVRHQRAINRAKEKHEPPRQCDLDAVEAWLQAHTR